MARLLMRGMTFLLVLVALAFGVSSSLMLNDPPYGDDLSGPQMTAWNGFFVLVAMLCVAAMVLGILSMSRRKIPTVLVWAFGATTLAVGVAGVVLTQEVFAGLAGDYSAMSHFEWEKWVSRDIDYIEACPGLPIP